MIDNELFEEALKIQSPWFISDVNFSSEEQRLDIIIDFERGSVFPCPSCKNEAKAYDTKLHTWRHLDFFQHKTYIHAYIPRIDCDSCGVLKIDIPWARIRSDFTLLFEACLISLMKAMPVSKVADLVGEHDTKLWRVLHHYVDEGRKDEDLSKVKRVGVDETSKRKGHDYISVFVDLDKSKTIFVTEGKDSKTIKSFKEDLLDHKGNSEDISDFSMDMSPAFISGVSRQFPNADITFDKFHVIKLLNEAVDQVRREEQKEVQDLKKSRYIWLKNPKNLNKKQLKKMDKLKNLKLKTARAYQIKLTLVEFWKQSALEAEPFLKKWYFWATHSQLEPIIKAAKTIKNHWDGVLKSVQTRINNAVLEGINSVIQTRKRMARGYRSPTNFKAIIYLVTGDLNFDLPT